MIVTALLLSSLVWAQSPEGSDQRAREFYEKGVILYDEGRYEDAVLAWPESWNPSEDPVVLYNVANAQERLGLWREALDTLNQYRVYAKPDERERLDRRIANLERRLAEEQQASPPVVAPIDEEPEATTAPASSTTTQREREPGGWLMPTAYAVGGAGVITGTIFAVRAGGARQDANSACQTVDGQLLCSSAAEDALRRDRVSSWVADSAFVLGGIGLVGGTALVLFPGAPIQPVPNGLVRRGGV